MYYFSPIGGTPLVYELSASNFGNTVCIYQYFNLIRFQNLVKFKNTHLFHNKHFILDLAW